MIHIPWTCGAPSSSSFASLTRFIFSGSYHWGHSLHDVPFRWNDSDQAAHPVLSSAEKKKGQGIPNSDISPSFSVSHDPAGSLEKRTYPDNTSLVRLCKEETLEAWGKSLPFLSFSFSHVKWRYYQGLRIRKLGKGKKPPAGNSVPLPPGESSPHHSLSTPGPSLWPPWHVSKRPSLPSHYHPSKHLLPMPLSDLPGLRLLRQPRNTERPGARLAKEWDSTLPRPKADLRHDGCAEPGPGHLQPSSYEFRQ